MKGKVFTAPEVQAIISGNKKMFREVIKSKPLIKRGDDYLFDDNGKIVSQKDCCPYQVGQKIFVKESFAAFRNNNSDIFYNIKPSDIKWKPATHMKQEQSRLTLLIKEIRAERLADINEEDCINEGFDYDWLGGKGNILIAGSITNNFAKNWNATHKKPEEKFEANPFVWSIQFEVVNE
jgi:predicted DNA-binding protein (UPF0251 family)